MDQPFSLPPLPDSSPKPQIHNTGLLSAQVPSSPTHPGCITVSSRPPFLFLDQAPTFCSILRDILGVGKMRWRGGRKVPKKSTAKTKPNKKNNHHNKKTKLKKEKKEKKKKIKWENRKGQKEKKKKKL